MWTRAELKQRAKDVLRGNYWSAFVVSIVLAIATANGSSGSNNSGSGYQMSDRELDWLLAAIPFIIGFFVIFLLLKIFVFYTLEVGGRKFFEKAAEGDSDMGYLGYHFTDGYMKTVGTLFLRDIFLFLWTLLLIIPGIIKSYAYRYVPYIIADNPEISATRAIEISNEMTRGHKWRIFVLDLSFIGWYLLGLLALGLGVLFVMPYHNATDAELYLVLRKEAIDEELTTYEELNIKPVEIQ